MTATVAPTVVAHTSRAYRLGRWTRIGAPYLIRIIAILVIALQISPMPPRPTTESPQVVQTSHPIVCVHTRLTDEVEAWKIQRSLQLVREMGAGTIVEFFPWAYYESAPGVFNWTHADTVMSYARQQGISVIARLGLVPDWARPKASDALTSLNSLTADQIPAYADFVTAFVTRYHDSLRAIIPWNEPNLAFEWGYRQVLPAGYVDLLKAAYMAAHAADPAIVVLGGALAPTLENSGTAITDLDYLRGIYAAGGKSYFDGLAVHSYGLTHPASDPPDPVVVDFRRVELLRQIMVANGDSTKPVYVTESGWNDAPRWTLAVSPAQRIADTIDAFQLAESQYPWLVRLCVWDFRTPTWSYSYPDNYALVTPDFVTLPIYNAIKAYARDQH